MSSASPDARRIVINLRDERPVWALPDWALEEIRAGVPDGWAVEVVEAPSDGRGDGGAPSPEALAAVARAEVYLGHGFPRELFAAAHGEGAARLRWVHSGAAGVAGSLYPEMRASDVMLTNSAGIYAEPMAETVLAMMLFFARGLDIAVRAQARGRWEKEELEGADSPVREVGGATVGIVGFGGIGQAVGRRAAALGSKVVALKRTPSEPPPGVELISGEGALHELIRRSDYLVLSLPETEETKGLIGKLELELLGPGGVLINVGRGSVLDEAELARALRERSIRGAALDVFAEEPLPAESELWDLPNVLITPHVSGISRSYWRREVDLILENLRRYSTGQPLVNLVDKGAGY